MGCYTYNLDCFNVNGMGRYLRRAMGMEYDAHEMYYKEVHDMSLRCFRGVGLV